MVKEMEIVSKYKDKENKRFGELLKRVSQGFSTFFFDVAQRVLFDLPSKYP